LLALILVARVTVGAKIQRPRNRFLEIADRMSLLAERIEKSTPQQASELASEIRLLVDELAEAEEHELYSGDPVGLK
jgi:hypothetical protein